MKSTTLLLSLLLTVATFASTEVVYRPLFDQTYSFPQSLKSYGFNISYAYETKTLASYEESETEYCEDDDTTLDCTLITNKQYKQVIKVVVEYGDKRTPIGSVDEEDSDITLSQTFYFKKSDFTQDQLEMLQKPRGFFRINREYKKNKANARNLFKVQTDVITRNVKECENTSEYDWDSGYYEDDDAIECKIVPRKFTTLKVVKK